MLQSGYKGSFQRFFADIAILVTKDLIVINEVVQPVCYQDLTSIHLQPGKIGVVSHSASILYHILLFHNFGTSTRSVHL